MSIKIAHECPNSIFSLVQKVTDYDYCLVHLLDENRNYLDQFKQAIENGREVILDNSLFELETPFDPDQFFYWVEQLKPTWYIIPDALEDKELTISNCKSWVNTYTPTSSKSIAVVQGKTYEEVVECYKAIEPLVDKVAISFDYSFFKEWYPNQATKFHQYVLGRQKMLQMLVSDGVINTAKPHHLLGCGLAFEFAQYLNYNWIDSLDTSNPVVAGIKGLRYGYYSAGWGLQDKPSQKLHLLINEQLTETQKQDIFFNIEKFRENLSKS